VYFHPSCLKSVLDLPTATCVREGVRVCMQLRLHVWPYTYIYIHTYIPIYIPIRMRINMYTFMYKCIYICLQINTNHMRLKHIQSLAATSTSEDRPLVRTRACGTALTGVYVHHIGTRVSIPHTEADMICGRGTCLNSDRGTKMPSGSAARSLLYRYSALHTRAACGEHKCLLLPVPACLRVLASACLSIPVHPPSRTHTPSITNHK